MLQDEDDTEVDQMERLIDRTGSNNTMDQSLTTGRPIKDTTNTVDKATELRRKRIEMRTRDKQLMARAVNQNSCWAFLR